MQRTSILADIKSQYAEMLDPTISDVNILIEGNTVYLEIVKDRNQYTIVTYKYDLKKWGQGKTHTAEELGISDSDDYSHEAKEFAHLSLPLFDVSNSIEVSVAQFNDIFLMEKEMLMYLTDLFILND